MKSRNLYHLSGVALWVAMMSSLSAPAWAGPDAGPGGPFGRDLFRAERLASKLELTETQRGAVEQLMDDARQQARPQVRKLMEQHKAMRALAEGEVFDEAAVRAKAAEGSAAMTELAVIHARNEFALRKLLTPAQREKLASVHGRHRRH